MAVGLAPMGFLIGEASESAQVTPVGTGAIAAIEVRQMQTHGRSQGRLQGSQTDMNPLT
jgi:hypothetical protein